MTQPTFWRDKKGTSFCKRSLLKFQEISVKISVALKKNHQIGHILQLPRAVHTLSSDQHWYCSAWFKSKDKIPVWCKENHQGHIFVCQFCLPTFNSVRWPCRNLLCQTFPFWILSGSKTTLGDLRIASRSFIGNFSIMLSS